MSDQWPLVEQKNGEISKLYTQLSTLQAALEQATKERDEAVARYTAAELRESQVMVYLKQAKLDREQTNEDWHKEFERAEKAEAALAHVQGERDRRNDTRVKREDGRLIGKRPRGVCPRCKRVMALKRGGLQTQYHKGCGEPYVEPPKPTTPEREEP